MQDFLKYVDFEDNTPNVQVLQLDPEGDLVIVCSYPEGLLISMGYHFQDAR